VDKEKLVKLWKSSALCNTDIGIFRDSSTMRDKVLSTIWLISLKQLFTYLHGRNCLGAGLRSPSALVAFADLDKLECLQSG